MAVPWLRVLDAVLGMSDLARTRKARPSAAVDEQLDAGARVPAALETRLAGVLVAALKEAFDRDKNRLDAEREHLAAERERAERALRLELRRLAGDREIGRLRLLGAVAIASWLATLLFAARVLSGGVGARVALGGGWLLLLLAFASSFAAQSRVVEALNRSDDAAIASGPVGAFALWLIVAGLALVGVAVLV